MVYIQGWAKEWNIHFYFETTETNVTKLCKVIYGIVGDVLLFFSCFGCDHGMSRRRSCENLY